MKLNVGDQNNAKGCLRRFMVSLCIFDQILGQETLPNI